MKKEILRKITENPDLTAFQKKVLRATLNIPRGEVRSYGHLAKEVGSPGAAHAVGSVMAKNPYAPQVPCHRVISSTGAIGGYSGGITKKRRLLNKEGVKI